MRCPRCGFVGESIAFETKLVAFFVKQAYCLRCISEEAQKSARNATWISVAASLVLGALAALFLSVQGEQSAGWFLASLAFMIPFLVLSTIPHEMGHMLAARILRFEVFQVAFGFGECVWSGCFAGIPIVINKWPIGGITIAGGPDEKVIRLRRSVLSLGGPAVNVTMIAAYFWLTASLRGAERPNLLTAAGTGFLWANIVILGINLAPHYIQTSLGRVPSDGLAFFSALVAGPAKRKSWIEAYYAIGWHFARQRGDTESAVDWSEKGIAAVPDSLALQMILGVMLIEAGKIEPARDLFLALLRAWKLDARTTLLVKNNVAYCDFLLERDLEEADRYSREAVQMLPWQPEFNSTRGAVLTVTGRSDEAVTFLHSAFQTQSDVRGRAETACILAIAYANVGLDHRAREYLELARELDPRAQLLERARGFIKDERNAEDSVAD